jgi:hypothetical protein
MLDTPVASAMLVPPALIHRLDEAFRLLDEQGKSGQEPSTALWKLERLVDDGEPWLGRDAALAEKGYALLEPRWHHEVRRLACTWLTLFPSAETARRLADVALDESAPRPVRDQAAWSLGYRQSRAHPQSVRWSEDAVRVADEALVTLAERSTAAGKIALEQLPIALRHVQSPALFEVLAKAPLLWGAAYESFLDEPLARVLLERLDELPEKDQPRALRVAAATLGAEAVPLLVAKSHDAPMGDRLELLMLALTFGGEAHLPALEALLAPMQTAGLFRQRAKWHLQNPSVVPLVRALRVARSTGVLAGGERAAACAKAADDFAALTPFQRHAEAYLYDLWACMVNGSGDPERARALGNAHPESREQVKALFVRDLAARGRTKQLTALAQELEAVEAGAFWLAVHGRPFAALELAATSRLQTPEVVAARVLALYRAGRPDLAERVFKEEPPPSEIVNLEALPPFPGPHERWLAEHAPSHAPATTALVRGLDAVIELGEAAPQGAEADATSLGVVGALERHLARPIEGATIYLAGDFPPGSKEQHAEAAIARGARLVSGPFPGTDYYVMGETCLVTTVSQLERQGTRRLRNSELGISW